MKKSHDFRGEDKATAKQKDALREGNFNLKIYQDTFTGEAPFKHIS